LAEVRIGDLLREKGLVRASDLAAAVEEQAREGRRLCSILITRGSLDFDEGARVLGEQRGVPCALSKHLANRDVALAALLPADFGRASNALPIGRTSGGALIVAARDPAPALRASLEKFLGADVTLVITPATRLEHLIAAAYGVPASDEFDVDVDSQVDLPPLLPPLPDMLDPDSMRMALSDLDDARVAKDPTQSGLLQIGAMASSSSLKIPAGRLPPAAPTIEATKLALEHVGTRDVASDLAMSFIAGRWRSGAIVAIREDTAIGYRGHGIIDLAELHLPLRLASTVQRAIQTKRLAQGSPPSPAQDQLVKVLRSSAIVAAPVLVGDELVAVITAGDSIHGAADSNAPIELGQLAQALGDAYDRIRRT
jgi:hypothetical protein